MESSIPRPLGVQNVGENLSHYHEVSPRGWILRSCCLEIKCFPFASNFAHPNPELRYQRSEVTIHLSQNPSQVPVSEPQTSKFTPRTQAKLAPQSLVPEILDLGYRGSLCVSPLNPQSCIPETPPLRYLFPFEPEFLELNVLFFQTSVPELSDLRSWR